MFGAWVLAPAILALSAIGWGGLVELAVGRQIPGLRFPLGLAAMSIALSGLIILGISAEVVVVIAAVAAFAGLVSVIAAYRNQERDPARTRERRWIALTGLVAFGVMMAPLVGSGRAGILGYVFNNDPAAHLSAVELLRTSGLHYFEQANSTFQQVSGLFEDSYPIGSHVLVLYTSVISGAEGFFIWSPLIALTAAGVALAIRALLAQFDFPAWAVSLGAVAAACCYLAFSYVAQGGFKEILLAMTVLLAVASAEFARREGFAARSLIPFAVAGGAALSIFGPAAAFWVLPVAAAYVFIALRRPVEGTTRGKLAAGFAIVGLGAVVVLIPQLIDAVGFARVQGAGGAVQEFGNLLGPLRWSETLGIWFLGDYRIPVPSHENINLIFSLLAAVILLVGLVACWRRKQFAPAIAIGTALIACAWLHFNYSPYIEAKGLLVLSLCVATLIVIGTLALSQRFRVTGIVVAIILLVGAGYSTWLVYSSVWMTPKERLTELAAFNDQLAGKGPVLVNDREAYSKLLMRDAQAIDIWSSWIPGRGNLTTTGVIENPPHTPDSDDYADDFRNKFDWFLDRRHPGSRPPGNFTVAAESAHYVLWKRAAPPVKQHIGLGYGVVGGAVPLQCDKGEVAKLIKRHPSAKVRLAIAPETVKRQMAPAGKLPPGFVFGPQPEIFARNTTTPASAAASAAAVNLEAGEKYDVYVQGSFAAGFMNVQDGYPTGESRQDMGTQDGWQRFGTFVAPGPSSAMLAALTKPIWQAGSARADLVGPTAFVPTSGDRIVVTTGKGLKKYCGRNADWVERL